MTPTPRTHGWLTLLAVLILLTASACSKESAHFQSTDITGADFAHDFALADASGQLRHLADFKGKAVIVFFGYTHCPDICPNTLTKMAAAMNKLGEDAKSVQLLFISLDPQRDKPEVLAKYVPAFYPTFLALYGDTKTTADTAKEFKVFYNRQEGSTPDTYTIDHSAGCYVYDPEGRLRLYFGAATTVDQIAADLKLLVSGA